MGLSSICPRFLAAVSSELAFCAILMAMWNAANVVRSGITLSTIAIVVVLFMFSCLSSPAIAASGENFEACIKDKSGAKLYQKGGDGYDDAAGRALYPSPEPNWYIDIDDVDQVAPAVKCIREAGFGVCPRTGGHSFVGQSSCKDVVMDLHQLKSVEFNSESETVTIEIGNTLGEALYGLYDQSDGKRMFGIGLCPSVGVAGYLLGGGHNPYSGLLGLTCESVERYDFVTLEGKNIVASEKENPELFWASCGGGGAHYAILIRATIKTRDAEVFNNNVYFRYEWDLRAAGEIIHKWLDYDQDDGMTWFRLEINANTGIYGYGVCWDADSEEACEKRLLQHAFFNVDEKSRHKHILKHSDSVLEFQAFIGPAGDWGWKKPKVDAKNALVGQNFMERGDGLHRLYSSSFWKIDEKPSVEEMQKMAEICSKVDADHLEFALCQWNPWKGEQIRSEGKRHAFAHRDFEVFTELIGSVKPSQLDAGMAEMKRVESEVKDLTNKYIGGIYVSYPEFGLSQEEYSYLYWGQSLPRLVALRDELDSDGVFQQNQPMPRSLKCPGSLEISGSGSKRTIAIDGYAGLGQRPGMRIALLPSSDCSVMTNATTGAIVEVVKAVDEDGNEVDVFEATVLTSQPFTIVLEHKKGVSSVGSCKLELVAINSISCGKYNLKSNSPLSKVVNSSEEKEKSSDKSCFPQSATVELDNGRFVEMKDLSIGDRVRVSSTEFSEIFFFSHRDPDATSDDFVDIATCDGVIGRVVDDESCETRTGCNVDAPRTCSTCATRMRRLTVTRGHYVIHCSGHLVSAGSLHTGDMVRVANIDERMSGKCATVIRVSRSDDNSGGLYNPHTLSGTIVVNGIVASCYTQAVHPTLARILLTPLMTMFRLAHYTPELKQALNIARPRFNPLAGPTLVLS